MLGSRPDAGRPSRVALALWLTVTSLSALPLLEPARSTTCDPSVTGNCCVAAFGDSRLHHLLFVQFPFCTIAGLALGWGLTGRPDQRAGRWAGGFLLASSVPGFASTLAEAVPCWTWAPERHGHDVRIALFAACLGGLFVGLPLALTAGHLASRNGAGTEPKRIHWT